MNSPLFSVVVPAFGRPKFLVEAVNSILLQSVRDLEVIIVDDCSPEPLLQPVDDPRVRLVRREQNGGQSAAINTGLEHAKGRYVAFLDDDDLYRNDRLALALEGLGRAPMCICWSSYIGSRPGRGPLLEGNVHDVILNKTTPSLGATVVERNKCPILDTSYVASADIEWWIRASGQLEVATVPKVAHLVRRHDGERKLNGTLARIRSAERLIDQYADYFYNHPAAHAHRLFSMGVMSKKIGQYREAKIYFRRSLKIKPSLRVLLQMVRTHVRL